MKLLNSSYQKIALIFCSFMLTFVASLSIAAPLDEVEFNIVMTSDGYPIIWPKDNIYGFDTQLSMSDFNELQYCSSGAGCDATAVAKGGRYFDIHNVAGVGLVAVYYDIDGKLIATQQAGGTGPEIPTGEVKTTYLHHDPLGSVITTSDSGGNLKQSKYLSYGLSAETEVGDPKPGYTGKTHFKGMGLTYFGSRWYDPEIGRFITVDPVSWLEERPVHSFNRYAYANNNPYKYVDPDGEIAFLIPLAIFVAKELAAEGASQLTDGATDFLSVRRMGTKGIKGVGKLIKKSSNVQKSTVQMNQAAGTLGEDKVRARLLDSKSVELVGEQIRINTPGIGSHRVTDFIVRGKKTGKLRAIEVKTGGAKRNKSQLAKDSMIEDPSSATAFYGKRARASGFSNGTPTGGIRTHEVNASNLKK